ncbi:universal stress protein [Thermodesulfobacteriota bacterium]
MGQPGLEIGFRTDTLKHILLYSTGEKGSVPTFSKIVDLAKLRNGKITIVDVFEQTPSLPQRLFASDVYEEVKKIAEARIKKRLDRLTAQAQDRGVDATSAVLFGKPFGELIRTALIQEHDLIVKTARVGVGLRERLMGSTALHLIRKSPAPVLVVQPKRRVQFNRILVPLDFRNEDSDEKSINTEIMEKAISIAELDGSQLNFLHVWRPYGVSLLSGGRTRMSQDKIQEYVKTYKTNHKEMFEEFLNRYSFGHLEHRVYFERGDPALLIPEVSARRRISLVVIGSTYSTGIGGIFMGSTAEQVIGQINCSVLTLKPRGFVTPVDVVTSVT